jgi:hypothetical protein
MLRDWPWLARLRRVGLSPPRPSCYRIRRQPRPECVSTLEAVVYALQLLEPETTGLDSLIAAFVQMETRQLSLEARRRSPRPRPSRRHVRRTVPRALREDPRRLVVCYAEVLGRGTTGRPELLYWAAYRPATRSTFDCFVRSPAAIAAAEHLRQLGLPLPLVAGGSSREVFDEAWRGFCAPDDLVAAWNQSTLSLLAHPQPPRRLELKTLYCNLTRGRAGHLGEVVVREGLRPELLPLHGRAARRLGEAVAMAAFLRVRWSGRPPTTAHAT